MAEFFMIEPVASDTHERTVRVALAERSYDIVVGQRLLDSAGERIARACAGSAGAGGRLAVIVTDPPVEKLYAEAVSASLETAGFSTMTVCLPGGETQKTLAALDLIYAELHVVAADRRTVVVALGGGVVGDIAGYAAASYLRGLDFVQVPTTLLAQVDSSVGGKTGVNYGSAKNSIGAFYQPSLVLIDTETLSTLSTAERRSGLAEVIKYGAIADARLFALLQSEAQAIIDLDSPSLSQVIARSCEIKASVVEQDERETTGARATLNFGHTIGHALEAATQYARYRHGEAIALGMVAACLIGEELGVTDATITEALVDVLATAGFDIAPDVGISDEAIVSLLALDKKSIGGSARFVLLDGIGSASAGHEVPTEVVVRALERQQRLKSG